MPARLRAMQKQIHLHWTQSSPPHFTLRSRWYWTNTFRFALLTSRKNNGNVYNVTCLLFRAPHSTSQYVCIQFIFRKMCNHSECFNFRDFRQHQVIIITKLSTQIEGEGEFSFAELIQPQIYIFLKCIEHGGQKWRWFHNMRKAVFKSRKMCDLCGQRTNLGWRPNADSRWRNQADQTHR